MVPSGAVVWLNAPTVTLTVGSPNRLASAGARKTPTCPRSAKTMEPSEPTVTFPGPDKFSVMVLPVLTFVNEAELNPVTRKVIEPSEALRTLTNSLFTTGATRTLNPQNDAGKVKGSAAVNCHFGPRAKAGAAVTTPPKMPSSAPSATIIPNRLMATTPHSRPPPCGRCRALFSYHAKEVKPPDATWLVAHQSTADAGGPGADQDFEGITLGGGSSAAHLPPPEP